MSMYNPYYTAATGAGFPQGGYYDQAQQGAGVQPGQQYQYPDGSIGQMAAAGQQMAYQGQGPPPGYPGQMQHGYGGQYPVHPEDEQAVVDQYGQMTGGGAAGGAVQLQHDDHGAAAAGMHAMQHDPHQHPHMQPPPQPYAEEMEHDGRGGGGGGGAYSVAQDHQPGGAASPGARRGAGGTSKRRGGASGRTSPGVDDGTGLAAPGTPARRRMDAALSDRRTARRELREAEDLMQTIKERLDAARKNVDETEDMVKQVAEQECDALLEDDTPWNNMYRKLMEFRGEYGHVNVKQNFGKSKEEKATMDPDKVRLGQWVGKNRREGRRVKARKSNAEGGDGEENGVTTTSSLDNDPESINADPYKIAALDRLGFDWTPHETRWHTMFEQLKRYKEKNGDCLVPHANQGLGSWVKRQQVQYTLFCKRDGTKSELTEERVRLLNDLGFVWSRRTAAWDENVARLKKYKEEHGDCNVPDGSDDPETQALYRWVQDQRNTYRRIKAGLEEEREPKGNRRVTKLNAEKIKFLEEMGFEFDARDAKWLKKFKALLQYKEKHGNFLVPSAYREDPSLSSWVTSQRSQFKLYSKGKKSLLTERRVQILTEAGFVVDGEVSLKSIRRKAREDAATHDTAAFKAKPWGDQFKELLFYMASNKGDTTGKNNPILAEWVQQQREQYKILQDGGESTLSEEQIAMLNTIEFAWDKSSVRRVGDGRFSASDYAPASPSSRVKKEDKWEERYSNLAAWYVKHGSYNPKGMGVKLKKWIAEQQEQYKLFEDNPEETDLTEERISKLDALHFPWDPERAEATGVWKHVEKSWDEMHAALAKHYILTGSYNIQHLEDRALRKWAADQKIQVKSYMRGEDSSLTYSQVQKLVDIKFVKNPASEKSWDENFADLMAYKIKFDTFEVIQPHGKKISRKMGVQSLWVLNNSLDYRAVSRLRQWVDRQRALRKETLETGVENELTQERIDRLDAVHFPWFEPGEDPAYDALMAASAPKIERPPPPPPGTRKRGRPRKPGSLSKPKKVRGDVSASGEPPVKRKRGRPRKNKPPPVTDAPAGGVKDEPLLGDESPSSSKKAKQSEPDEDDEKAGRSEGKVETGIDAIPDSSEKASEQAANMENKGEDAKEKTEAESVVKADDKAEGKAAANDEAKGEPVSDQKDEGEAEI